MFTLLFDQDGLSLDSEQVLANPDLIPEMYGPDDVHYIDMILVDDRLALVFSVEREAQDPAVVARVIQSSMLVTQSGRESILLSVRNAKEAPRDPTSEEMRAVAKFFAEVYLAGRKKDVTLLAKAMLAPAEKLVTYYCSTGPCPDYDVIDVSGRLDDFLLVENVMAVLFRGRIAMVPAPQLDQCLRTGVMADFTEKNLGSTPVGQETRLARGPKINRVTRLADTVAYIKHEPDGPKMIVLDPTELKEMRVARLVAMDSTFPYALFGRSGEQVYLVGHSGAVTIDSGMFLEEMPG